jgi:hypothetical protein
MFCIDAARGIFLAKKDVFDNCGEWPQPKPIENAWGPTPEEKTQVHHLDCGTPGPAPAERVGRRWVGRSTHHNFRQEAQQNINSDEFAGIMRSNATDIPPSAIIMRPSASMFCRPIRAHLVGQWCVRQRRIKWGLFTNLGGISRTGFPHTIIWI